MASQAIPTPVSAPSNPASSQILTTVYCFLSKLCFRLLNNGFHVNPHFHLFIQTENCLAEILSEFQFHVIPEVLEFVSSTNPPPFELLMTLGNKFPSKSWGVYMLIFTNKDPALQPLIYIGSSVALPVGLITRVNQHKTGHSTTPFIIQAYQLGYKLVREVPLVYSDIPPAEVHDIVKGVVLLLEGAMACLFWSMIPPTEEKQGYGLESQCPWPISSFTYSGLCSHSPLTENFALRGLSDEQKGVVKAQRTAHYTEYRRQLFAKKYANESESAKRKRLEESTDYQSNYYQTRTLGKRAKARKDKSFYCDVCDLACPTQGLLASHLNSKAHKDVLRKSRLPKSYYKYHCPMCRFWCKFESEWKVHLTRQKHIDNERRQSSCL